MTDSAEYVYLEKGDICFVPFGYVSWILGVSEGHNLSVMVPLLSQPLLSKSDRKVQIEVVKHLGDVLEAVRGNTPWNAFEAELFKWLEGKTK